MKQDRPFSRDQTNKGSWTETTTVWDVDQTVQAMANTENISIVLGYGFFVAQHPFLVVKMTALFLYQ